LGQFRFVVARKTVAAQARQVNADAARAEKYFMLKETERPALSKPL
jgi:hypothetical protein